MKARDNLKMESKNVKIIRILARYSCMNCPSCNYHMRAGLY